MKRLAHGEEADDDDDDVDAIEQVERTEGEASLAGLQIDADEAEQQAEAEAGEAAHHGIAEHGGDGDEGKHHQGEIVRRGKGEREFYDHGGEQAETDDSDRARDEGADCRRCQRRTAAALARHAVAFERRHDGGAFAGRVDEDRGRRAAELRTEIDAAEDDEGGGRVDLEGDRQQQRNGQGRSEARQHADECAERDAEQRP